MPSGDPRWAVWTGARHQWRSGHARRGPIGSFPHEIGQISSIGGSTPSCGATVDVSARVGRPPRRDVDKDVGKKRMGSTTMWDTVETNTGPGSVHLSHDLPCTDCGH